MCYVVQMLFLSDNRLMTNKNTITLTAEQISLLLQVLTEQVSNFRIEPSEQNLADEVIDILESAEDEVYSN